MSSDIYTYIHFTLLFIASFVLTYLLIPRIIGVITYKQLMDNPNERSSHTHKTPSLGGIAFYITFVMGIFFAQDWDINHNSMSILVGLIILFIVGLKDDLVVLGAKTKILAQLLAISFVLYSDSFHVHSFHGFLGIYEVSTWITIPLSAFIMLSIINAYNLIDGIDGLASTVGIIIFTLLGGVFFYLEFNYFAAISILMIGTLTSFLRFNLSNKKRIFMGDTGSLIIGYLLSILVVKLFTLPAGVLNELPFQTENLPIVILAILIVPFFDTVRVFTIRVLNKKGPFSPDRNHTHHLLIDYLKLSHRRASFFVGVFNFVFAVTICTLAMVLNYVELFVVFVLFALLMLYFFYKINNSKKNLRRKVRNKQKTQKIILKNRVNLF